MLLDELGLIIGVICLVLSIVFFLGKGEGIISAFESRNAPIKKKKSPEDERRYQRAFGVFCIVIAISEFSDLFLPIDDGLRGIISIVVVVLDFIFITVYLRKNFPEG